MAGIPVEQVLDLLADADLTPSNAALTCRGEARVECASLRMRRAAALYDAAEEIGGQSRLLAVADANALGCCYRRRGDLELALEILYQGMGGMDDVLSAASLHLNLGAALAGIGRHADAADQANAAVIVVQAELLKTVNMPMQQQVAEGAQMLAAGLQLPPGLAPAEVAAEAARRLAGAEQAHFEERILHLIQTERDLEQARELRLVQKQAADRHRAAANASPTLLVEIQRLCIVFGLQQPAEQAGATAEMQALEDAWVGAKVSVLAAAYHNAGVQQEALKEYDLAVQSYVDATNIARTHLGRDSDLTSMLAASRDACARENPKSIASKRLAGEVRQELRGIFKSHRMQIKEAFRQFDLNGDGFLDEREMRKGLNRMNVGLSAQQVEDLLAVMDRDGNGVSAPAIPPTCFLTVFGSFWAFVYTDSSVESGCRRWTIPNLRSNLGTPPGPGRKI